MATEEKRVWVYAMIAFSVPAVYAVIILGRLSGAEAAEIAYEWPMLGAIGAGMLLNMFLQPQGADRKDERDAHINRRGEHAGFYVLAAVVAIGLVLTMAGAERFWIANTLYLAFVLNALTSSIVKIVAYRQGF